ncbi:MAG: prephenate dehydrogenase [Flavobacteriales bacterium]|nr:prephenate dehydrogenase [Flavobacteriales bacterium]
MKVGVIGLGLIGGSLAISLKKNGVASSVIGMDSNDTNANRALELGLISKVSSLNEMVTSCDLVILAIPVDAARIVLKDALDTISGETVIMDMGSTKAGICESISNHPNRKNYVAAHPIAGTEFSGPDAAIPNLFNEKVTIICEAEKADQTLLSRVESMYSSLNMRVVHMSAEEHDLHMAYVSHLSHISSFALSTTVLDKEKDEKTIFDLAGSGFESTVRLAKSSPEMWGPIFRQNAKNVSQALGTYIEHLTRVKEMMDNGEEEKLKEMMEDANGIKKILNGINNN